MNEKREELVTITKVEYDILKNEQQKKLQLERLLIMVSSYSAWRGTKICIDDEQLVKGLALISPETLETIRENVTAEELEVKNKTEE